MLTPPQLTRLYPTIVRIIMFTIGLEGHGWVVDSRQLIPFTFSVQTGQLASPMNMTILRIVG